ncbi:hypothetical protein KDN34_15905 [Shewanella yunxiaonensis]|uniref:Uncharacterized protein n=1 Tax=Shewanella yunxiaonensis TaxID=2829809 RepID=A0ABX7YT13_9GAMM|nr:hypothetical protein [Shewanella yunxiaonensis]QUN05648.1 hypothetical protein KDN34_15905 [Shewanella yunxiaonensis]
MAALDHFFTEAYWWLSLLGGLHCLMLAGYAMFVYLDRSDQKWLLASIFGLLALYFFTGMLNQNNMPTHLLFLLLLPTYFLVLPLVYLYCRRLCYPHLYLQLPFWHVNPMLVAMTLVVVTLFIHHASIENVLAIAGHNSFNGLTLWLTLALSLQTLLYVWLILRLLLRHQTQVTLSQDPQLQLRFRWLLILTIALMINWLVRTVAFALLLLFGDQISPITQTVPHVVLLLTIYALALYGLKQLTHLAYLRGRAARQKLGRDNVLTEEERQFIRQLMRSGKHH